MGRLYQTEDLQHDESGITAGIRLNKDDDVFRGHFPDHPLLPGVCTLQIIKEVLSEVLAKELMLEKAPNIKYLAFIDPFDNDRVQLDVRYTHRDGERIGCSAKVHSGTVIFCSFKGDFVFQD
jgi:3-hydroxyacyl-[acyl-carrier-protein] dehydratase